MLKMIFMLLSTIGALLLCVLGFFFLIFHREISAVRLARRLGSVMDTLPCSQCGDCCRLTVITDRKTVTRIAEATERPVQEFAHRLPFNLYRMKKEAGGACVMLQRPKEKDAPFICGIYSNRPSACRRFPSIRFPFGIRGCDPRCTPLRKQAAARSLKGNKASS
jgi:Fe-S-cluster containining protein